LGENPAKVLNKKNLPKLFWVRNPRNFLSSVEEQALVTDVPRNTASAVTVESIILLGGFSTTTDCLMVVTSVEMLK
jgi:hypothetical protein